jgi:hypothetical protein
MVRTISTNLTGTGMDNDMDMDDTNLLNTTTTIRMLSPYAKNSKRYEARSACCGNKYKESSPK